jgi:hypothetical protein
VPPAPRYRRLAQLLDAVTDLDRFAGRLLVPPYRRHGVRWKGAILDSALLARIRARRGALHRARSGPSFGSSSHWKPTNR